MSWMKCATIRVVNEKVFSDNYNYSFFIYVPNIMHADSDIKIETPENMPCSDRSCISCQFKTAYGNYTYIANDKVNLRSGPRINSEIITTLHISTKVTILYRSNINEKINDNAGE